MTRARLIALVIAVALVTGVWILLPPAAVRLAPPPDPLTARGAIHVHTVRSDGAGTPDEVAAAARRAGLDFVVLTDHGDATRVPDPPRYVDGVLVIDAVEISTTDGHLIALGLPRAPYRLAGEARDVLADVHRLGGFGIAAHPDSPKRELQWRDWKAELDGIEWLNADSEWRDESRAALTRALVTYWFRPRETMASLFDRPGRTLDRWDHLIVTRPLVAIAGDDAHARLPLSPQADINQEGRWLGLPSYAAAFGALSQAVILTTPLGHTAESAGRDATAILTAIRAGATYTVIDGVAGPAALDFHAIVDGKQVQMGKSVETGHLRQFVGIVKPTVPGAITTLLRDGREVTTASNGDPLLAPGSDDTSASYRIEVRLPRGPGTPPVPWIVSNPIYVRDVPDAPRLDVHSRSVMRERAQFDGTPGSWTAECSVTSDGRVDVSGDAAQRPALHFTWRLGSGRPAGQYAALSVPVSGHELDVFNALSVTISSSVPARVSVQLRIPQGAGLRWRRSIYADQRPRTITIDLRDMTAVEAPPGTALDVAKVDSLLVVVDTVNATPGSVGELWLSDVKWQELAGP